MAGRINSPVEKRSLEDSEIDASAAKRSKVEDAEVSTRELTQQKINSSELASAFALASLASLSRNASVSTPKKSIESPKQNSRQEVQNASSWEETRSPEATQAPVTPDQRSPGSPGSKSQDADDTSPDSNKRVHFAPSTKTHQPSTPTSILKSSRQQQQQPKRRIALPVQHQSPGAFAARMRGPPPYGMNGTAFGSPAHVSPHPMHSPHSLYHHHAPQQWYHGPSPTAPPMAGRLGYVPQRLMQPPLQHPENQWICDYCNVASFASYEEACVHEASCKIRCSAIHAPPSPHRTMATPPHLGPIHSHPSLMSRSSSGDEEAATGGVLAENLPSAASDNWYAGTMALAIEESDCEWLSDLNCFIRRHCVEAFSATDDDVSRSSKRGRIAPLQVGIRCCFCKHIPSKDKSVAAVSFPTSIGGIYESVKRWQRVHLEICDSVPQSTRDRLTILSKTNAWVPTTRQYWTDSARALGLVDTNEGIRFGINPQEVTSRTSMDNARKLGMARHMGSPNGTLSPRRPAMDVGAVGSPTRQAPLMPTSDGYAPSHSTEDSTSTSGYIIFPEDMEMIPPYVYVLMRQVEPCRFTEADRFVARSKGPVGYPGFQCRHCNGHAGLGKYFPVSAKSLSTNSTSQNIHAHLLKCRKCPDHIKDRLVQLKIEKGRSPRLEPGWRKVFFDKVWARLHG